MKNMRKKFIPHIVLAIICVFVWYKTLNQSFLGEGFYYYDSLQRYFVRGILNEIWEYDNFAKMFFAYTVPFLKDNIFIYQIIQLGTLIALTITLFHFIKHFTKNSWIGFTSAAIFSASYLGLFEMIGVGNYQRFIQRVPNQILILLSFMELAKFYETGKISKYINSLILFTISVFFAHFSTFLLPFYIIYPIVSSFVNKEKVIKFFKNITLSIPFVVINLFLISQDVHTPDGNFINFIKLNGLSKIISSITLQLSNMLIPPFLIEKIASVTSSYRDILIAMTVPIIALFLLGIFIVKNKQKKLLTIYLSSMIMIPILLFLNLYLGKIDPLYNMRGYTYYFLPNIYSQDPSLTASLKGDRCYMLPYLFLAIIISILIYVLFINFKKFYKAFTIVFITGYVLYNASLVRINIDKIQPASEDMKKYLSYIKYISPKLNNQSFVIVPREFLWPSQLIRQVYNLPRIQFIANYTNWKEIITNIDKKNIVLIDFYYGHTPDGKLDPANNHIVNPTSDIPSLQQ